MAFSKPEVYPFGLKNFEIKRHALIVAVVNGKIPTPFATWTNYTIHFEAQTAG